MFFSSDFTPLYPSENSQSSRETSRARVNGASGAIMFLSSTQVLPWWSQSDNILGALCANATPCHRMPLFVDSSLGHTDPTMVVLFILLLLAMLIQSSTRGDLALRQDHLGQDDRGQEGFRRDREGDGT